MHISIGIYIYICMSMYRYVFKWNCESVSHEASGIGSVACGFPQGLLDPSVPNFPTASSAILSRVVASAIAFGLFRPNFDAASQNSPGLRASSDLECGLGC